ncbi:MAG: HD domain-containing protein [Saprospiraceae bacterium]|nr:HD domain-containing protein [Saprospiraceae bacterium]MDW8484674.1 HD domain-containing protein [Saprospiraceae bacterium]
MRIQRKIFNDPVYGFVSVPKGLLLEIIDHPYFQRLRRIRQVGMAHYVYPGALHTRFHHALGALHLTQQAIEVLRGKGVEVTDEELEAVGAAILLHDIGHGPYSHALEHTLVKVHHEELSLMFMQALNHQYKGRLTRAIQIFTDRYPKRFLHQLVSSQLDMDRMDYLNRDSFFTGVSEGVIGYDRIIKMLAVHNGELVVEEKGIYSIEKFLIARRLMYWQVYLHKTNVAAEQMVIHLLRRARQLALEGVALEASEALRWFLYRKPNDKPPAEKLLKYFARLDDVDVAASIKAWCFHSDPMLAFLANGLIERRLFRLEWRSAPIEPDYIAQLHQSARQLFGPWGENLIFTGASSNLAYDPSAEKINILFKDGRVLPIDECSDVPLYTQTITKYFVCYPKIIRPASL